MHMKKILALSVLLLSVVMVPQQKVWASNFVCKQSDIGTTTATLTILKPANSLGYVNVLDTTNPIGSSQQAQSSTPNSTNTVVTNVYEYLTPGTAYKVYVFNESPDSQEELVGCAFTTKSTTTTPPATTNPPTTTPTQTTMPTSTQPTGVTQTGTNYDITMTVDNVLKQAKIYARSKLAFDTTGTIGISAAGDISHPLCNVTIQSAQISSPLCGFYQLTAGKTYTVTVIGKDSNGREYRGTAQFTVSTAPTTQPGATPTSGTPVIPTGQPGATPTGGTFTPTNPNAPKGTGFQFDVRLENPLKVDNITDAVKFFVNTLVKIAIPFIVIFFIWSGLKFILAQGKPDEITKAKKMFWYTIIGTLLILGAWTITNAIVGTINSITT